MRPHPMHHESAPSFDGSEVAAAEAVPSSEESCDASEGCALTQHYSMHRCSVNRRCPRLASPLDKWIQFRPDTAKDIRGDYVI